MRKHEHRFDAPWRGQRRCKICGRQQFSVAKNVWRDEMTLPQFAEKWLPAISGTDPMDMMTVKVAFPFEWNCYENWKTVWRVRFHFDDVTKRRQHGTGTRTDVMNRWLSKYQECWVRIDHEAELYYAERMGKPYLIGDNTYEEMRRIIQS